MCQRCSAWGHCRQSWSIKVLLATLGNAISSKCLQNINVLSSVSSNLCIHRILQVLASHSSSSNRAPKNHCKFQSFPDLLLSEMLRHLQFETHSTPQQKSETHSGDSIYIRNEQNQNQKLWGYARKGDRLKQSRNTDAKIVKFHSLSIVSPISCGFFPAVFSRMTTNGNIGPTMSSTLSGKMKATVVEGPESPIGLTNIQKFPKLFALNLQFHKLQPCPQPFSRRLATASVQQDTSVQQYSTLSALFAQVIYISGTEGQHFGPHIHRANLRRMTAQSKISKKRSANGRDPLHVSA